jgi:superfamily I DNA/RNA helicase
MSLTNVAQEEVRRRVREMQVPDGHPHFVGTIDSFLLRYVGRRFGAKLVNSKRFSHAVPDRDYSVQSNVFQYGSDSTVRDRLSTFRIGVGATGRYQVKHVNRDQTVTLVPDTLKETITSAKKEAWQTGEVTHSDVIAMAWRILSKASIADIVARRFPRILVDELQDTTGIRERCLRLLLESSKFDRGFVVGDPDQCIMDFAGADPKLFEDLSAINPDATREFSFTTCHRFHQGIAAATAPLRADRLPVKGVRPRTTASGTTLVRTAALPDRRTVRSPPLPRSLRAFVRRAGSRPDPPLFSRGAMVTSSASVAFRKSTCR